MIILSLISEICAGGKGAEKADPQIRVGTKIDSVNKMELIVSQSIKRLIAQRVNAFVFQFGVVKYLHKSQSGHSAADSISLLPSPSDY